MKKLSFLVSVLIVSIAVFASPVDPTRALQIAQEFVPQQKASSQRHNAPAAIQKGEIVYTHYMPKSGKPAIYVINIGDAFALVSADDVAHPILGYNYSKSWPTDGAALPPSVKGFLDDLAAQMEAAAENPQDAETAEEWRSPRKTPKRVKANDNLPDSVGPLLTTTWDQGQYYNSLCPEDGQSQYDGHVLTGCVATAMAQIIKYWGDKQEIKTRGIHSYDSKYGTLEVNYDTTMYDFAHMPDALTSESTPQEVNAIAKLMYHCGVSVNMQYSTNGSSAFSCDSRAALINYFNCSPNLSIAEKADFSIVDWQELMRKEIATGNPVYYSGRSGADGHAWVCCGYKHDNFFYFNYGWGGAADGWYQIDAVNETFGFNSGQVAIVGIEFDTTANMILGQTGGTSIFIVDQPMELYHIMGNNVYGSISEYNYCNNNLIFHAANETNQLVLETVLFDNQSISVKDGINGDVLYEGGGRGADIPPIFSSNHQLCLTYSGDMSTSGFCLSIHQDDNCTGVSNIQIESIEENGHQGVIVNWDDNCDVEQWEVTYMRKDDANNDVITFSTNAKPVTIMDISLGHEYTFGIRGKCNETHFTTWHYVSRLIDFPYWTDIVTQRPSGYTEDESGNINISSAEGLAWLSVVVSGLHDQPASNCHGKNIILSEDIDLHGYRWFPIGGVSQQDRHESFHTFNGNFDGNGHTISNLYINETQPYAGLFGYAMEGASFQNVSIINGSATSTMTTEGHAGGLLAMGERVKNIINCHSNVDVQAVFAAGALCGTLMCYDDGTESTVVSNCSATGNVYGREKTGGLIGEARGIHIRNCYARGDVRIVNGDKNLWYRGGLIGLLMSNSVVGNCYSTGNVEINNTADYYGKSIGYTYMNTTIKNVYCLNDNNLSIVGYMDYSYGSDVSISDISLFENSNNQQILSTPISIEGETYTNLLAVLNAWVTKTNDPSLKTWTNDLSHSNDGFPTFGNDFMPSCYNPTNVTISNATKIGDTTISTKIAWEQEGVPLRWEVLYVDAQNEIESGTIISVNTNPCTLTTLPVGKVIDIYVRAVCGEAEKSGWSKYVRFIPDKLRWTEVVTTQPDGYQVDGHGNVFISSAEGLAWLSSIVNQINGNSENTNIQRVSLMNDIELGAYRWTSIGNDGKEWANILFEGNDHTISNLYCNEYADYQGLFGRISGSTIRNLNINQSLVIGLVKNGIIAGEAGGYIVNCNVNGNIQGVMWTGGLVGRANDLDIHIYNSSFYGKAKSRNDITLPNYYNGFIGGISGEQFDAEILNAYVASEFSYFPFSGHIAGDGTGVFDYVYALHDFSGMGLTYNNLELNSSFFSGSGTSWTLNTPPYINGAFYSDLVEALNAWVDANNADGKYRHWVADTENINGGFPIFDPNENPSTNIDNINANAEAVKILYNGQILILRGDKIYTVTGQEVR